MKIMLARTKRGLVAGPDCPAGAGAARLEAGGVQDLSFGICACQLLGFPSTLLISEDIAKAIGTNNPHNVLRATMVGLSSLRSAEAVSEVRGKKLEAPRK